jgi:hypothetical protein
MPALLLLLLQAADWTAVDARLSPLWIGKEDAAAFTPPSLAERQALQDFGAAALGASPTLPPALAREGWRLEEAALGSDRLLLFHEDGSARRGRGVLVLRPEARSSRLVLMVPHRFFDRHTGETARAVFLASGAAALLENTAHRHWRLAPGEEYGPADAAHREETALHALACGLAAGGKGLLFAQLHGFGGGPEAGEQAPEAFAIVSDGTASPGAHARLAAARLKEGGAAALLYGHEARRLGATTNVLGRALRAGADDRFLHVEMSPALRETFRKDASTLAGALKAAATAD